MAAGATDQEPRGRQKRTTRVQVEEERISEEGYTASQRGVNQGRKGEQGRTRTSTDGGNGDSVINVALGVAEPAASGRLTIGTPTGLAQAIGARGLLCAVCWLPLQFVNN